MNRKLTVAECCLKYGVGSYNIDACRISADTKELYRKPTETKISSNNELGNMISSKQIGSVTNDYLKGRFPANLLFSHSSDCEYLGVEEEVVVTLPKSKDTVAYGHYKKMEPSEPRVSQVPKYNCSPDCPCKLLDEQSGVVKTGTWCQTDGARTFNNEGKKTNFKKMPGIKEPLGGASRFFMQFTPEEEDG